MIKNVKFQKILRMTKSFLSVSGIVVLIIPFLIDCSGSTRVNRGLFSVSNANKIPYYFDEFGAEDSKNYIKVHTKDGNLFQFYNNFWTKVDSLKIIKGSGNSYNFNRQLTRSGSFVIPYDSIALIEANSVDSFNGPKRVMTFVTVLSLGLSTYCYFFPKSCFGSCPTFYANDGEKMLLQAEGFSASVAPSLEETDIDALFRTKLSDKHLQIDITNEALETHYIKYSDILALPKAEGCRVIQTQHGEFYNLKDFTNVSSLEDKCSKDISAFNSFDGIERMSKADSNDLTKKESIILTYKVTDKNNKALVLAFRQSMMTTYIFYQTLAYMGKLAPEWFSLLERGDAKMRSIISLSDNLLGGIKVFVQDAKSNWISAGEVNEYGPIATEIKMVNLPNIISNDSIKVKLEMTQGLWKIDYAVLADVISKVEPIAVKPLYVTKNDSINEKAYKDLSDTSNYLITYPGDKYSVFYELPEDYSNYDLFVKSKGYYIEWYREEWLKEENINLVIQKFTNPSLYFKTIAPNYKKVEAQMEEEFWRSRYVKQ
jgi:hypothetical protein